MAVDRLCYISRACRRMAEHEIREMSLEFAQRNSIREISGILMYGRMHFLQVIEGDTKAIVSMYGSICRSELHREIQLLSYERGVGRRFSEWSMAVLNLDGTAAVPRGMLERAADMVSEFPLTTPEGPAVHLIKVFRKLFHDWEAWNGEGAPPQQKSA